MTPKTPLLLLLVATALVAGVMLGYAAFGEAAVIRGLFYISVVGLVIGVLHFFMRR